MEAFGGRAKQPQAQAVSVGADECVKYLVRTHHRSEIGQCSCLRRARNPSDGNNVSPLEHRRVVHDHLHGLGDDESALRQKCHLGPSCGNAIEPKKRCGCTVRGDHAGSKERGGPSISAQCRWLSCEAQNAGTERDHPPSAEGGEEAPAVDAETGCLFTREDPVLTPSERVEPDPSFVEHGRRSYEHSVSASRESPTNESIDSPTATNYVLGERISALAIHSSPRGGRGGTPG